MRIGIFLAASLFAAIQAPLADASQPVVGEPAPNFKATTLDGDKLQLSDFKGQVLILNFWASWCVPCMKEMPLLDVYFKARKDVGLRILAVATEDSVPTRKLRTLANSISFPVLRWLAGPYEMIGGAVPSNYIIDRTGVLRYAQAKAFTLDDLNTLLVPLLREPAPDADPASVSASP
jgi:peroxiredoxin